MPMTRRSLLSAGAAVALAAGSRPVRAATTMRIATGVDPGFAQFYLATQPAMMQAQGLAIELSTGPSGGATIPLLIGGDANASEAAVLAGIRTHLLSPQIVAVAQAVSYDNWYGIVSLKTIDTVAALKGKKIGIAPGTASETMWRRTLLHYQLDPKDFAAGIVQIDPPEMLAAIERGDVDAFCSWEPWLSKTVLQLPKTHILQTNQGIMLDVGFIYMNRSWIETHRDTALRFMRVMQVATKLLHDDPAKAKEVVGAYLKLPPQLVDALMPKLGFELKLDQQSYDQTKAVVQDIAASGKLKQPFDYAAWFYPDLLRSVDPAAVSLPATL